LTGGKANKSSLLNFQAMKQKTLRGPQGSIRAACALALWFNNLTRVKTHTTAATSLVNDAMVLSSDLFVD
jgi:hypothetical protein